jgi:hypothetical protein
MNCATRFSAIVFFAAVSSLQGQEADVIEVHGTLTRNGRTGTLWSLAPDKALQFREESIRQITFTTGAGEESAAFAPYDGKNVELVGEVKQVLNGKAVLQKVWTIGLEFSSESLASPGFDSPAGSGTSANQAAGSEPRTPYRHAYYLFLSGQGIGCEPCYIPLLITQSALEEIAGQRHFALGVFMITFERDSLWEARGAALLEPAAIEPQVRALRVNGRRYRYQEIVPGEVLRLLQNPAGTVPISRPVNRPKSVPGASVKQLMDDFRVPVAAEENHSQ